jgi:hypothetical protein
MGLSKKFNADYLLGWMSVLVRAAFGATRQKTSKRQTSERIFNISR